MMRLPLKVNPDAVRWFNLHDSTLYHKNRLTLDLKCGKLGADGRCRDYDNRPVMCREMAVGGSSCLQIRKLKGVDN